MENIYEGTGTKWGDLTLNQVNECSRKKGDKQIDKEINEEINKKH